MNKLTESNMGIFYSTLFGGDNSGGEEKKDGISLEASPEIVLLVIYEQPEGTGVHMRITLDPTRTTESLKKDLSYMTKVPLENICLIHKNTVLHDDRSLHGQGISPNDTVVFRDKRLKYNFP